MVSVSSISTGSLWSDMLMPTLAVERGSSLDCCKLSRTSSIRDDCRREAALAATASQLSNRSWLFRRPILAQIEPFHFNAPSCQSRNTLQIVPRQETRDAFKLAFLVLENPCTSCRQQQCRSVLTTTCPCAPQCRSCRDPSAGRRHARCLRAAET
uniref:Uncharacterized protein n=1 Tax=Arundo donax TaxID=35708 RepID=A0A0A9GAG9_ARUDO